MSDLEKNKIKKNEDPKASQDQLSEKKLSEVVLDAEAAEDKAEKEKAEAAAKKKKGFKLAHPRRFMFWMDLAGIFLLAVGLYLGIRYFMNSKFLSAYESGNYNTDIEQSLTNVNLVESYLPYYNLGNCAYQEGDYTRAIAFYKQALEQDPPKYKECPVRINLALAMIKTIDFNDLSTEKKLNNAVQTLRTARTILTAHQCAGPVEDDGHSPEAEQLKHDIDEWLKQLEDQQNNQDNQDGQDDQQNQDQNKDQQDQQDNQNQDDKETDEERKIREQLEEQQRQAQQERASEQQQYDNQNSGQGQEGGYGNDDFAGKYW